MKLRKIYSYLFEEFEFNPQPLNYELYWTTLLKSDFSLSSPSKLALIAKIIGERSTVLDVGCGNGDLLCYLEKTKFVQGDGIDVSECALEVARSKGVSVRKVDITKGDFTLDKSYDYIILSEVLEHLPNAEQVMLKLRERFNKCVLISIPNTGYVGERFRLLFGRFPKQWVISPLEHIRFWTVTDLSSGVANLVSR